MRVNLTEDYPMLVKLVECQSKVSCIDLCKSLFAKEEEEYEKRVIRYYVYVLVCGMTLLYK